MKLDPKKSFNAGAKGPMSVIGYRPDDILARLDAFDSIPEAKTIDHNYSTLLKGRNIGVAQLRGISEVLKKLKTHTLQPISYRNELKHSSPTHGSPKKKTRKPKGTGGQGVSKDTVRKRAKGNKKPKKYNIEKPAEFVGHLSCLVPDLNDLGTYYVYGTSIHALLGYLAVTERPFPLTILLDHVEAQHFTFAGSGIKFESEPFNLVTAMSILLADLKREHYSHLDKLAAAAPGRCGLYTGYISDAGLEEGEEAFTKPDRLISAYSQFPETSRKFEDIPADESNDVFHLTKFWAEGAVDVWHRSKEPELTGFRAQALKALREFVAEHENAIYIRSGYYFAGGYDFKLKTLKLLQEEATGEMAIAAQKEIDILLDSKKKTDACLEALAALYRTEPFLRLQESIQPKSTATPSSVDKEGPPQLGISA